MKPKQAKTNTHAHTHALRLEEYLERKIEIEQKIEKVKSLIKAKQAKQNIFKNNGAKQNRPDKKKAINKRYALEQKGYRIIAFTEAPSKSVALKFLKQFQVLTPEEYRVIEYK